MVKNKIVKELAKIKLLEVTNANENFESLKKNPIFADINGKQHRNRIIGYVCRLLKQKNNKK